MNESWTPQERFFIRENAGKLTDAEGAAKLSQITGRQISLNAYRKQRQDLGIRKEPGRGISRIRDPKKPYLRKKARCESPQVPKDNTEVSE